jgi:hypothetical protein
MKSQENEGGMVKSRNLACGKAEIRELRVGS